MRTKNQKPSDIIRSLEGMDERLEEMRDKLMNMISSLEDWGEIDRSLDAEQAELSAVSVLLAEEKRKADMVP